ncbi:hypothetical protein Skr01_36490 [Sphaerisporangium krabiense]|uniref:Uncharacterized protein n=1 Tax=Sphaerisporangium krabiense TaxID=763782 RepID=A0A7W8Z383_9ACTN|nr:hypothetical protein [Sphaerisporangium krabiense]MBB5626643.1 hypothetical protein [Sphaerisporangium krabiense]GII63564.1 hypothetical protein Skr01_36490 [Sphaerisporangium krabiense]
MTMTANEFLMGGGIAAAKFDVVGTTVSGQITQSPRVEQQKDLNTGEPKFWNDGKPMQQLLVTVQTTLRDPEVDDDNGERTFYIKAKMLAAVREAVRRAGAKGLEVGGTLAITYTGDGEATKRGFNPPKLYSATYTPPSAAAANDFLNGGQAPAAAVDNRYNVLDQQQAAQQAAPAPAPAPAPADVDAGALQAALASLTPEQRAALKL